MVDQAELMFTVTSRASSPSSSHIVRDVYCDDSSMMTGCQ